MNNGICNAVNIFEIVNKQNNFNIYTNTSRKDIYKQKFKPDELPVIYYQDLDNLKDEIYPISTPIMAESIGNKTYVFYSYYTPDPQPHIIMEFEKDGESNIYFGKIPTTKKLRNLKEIEINGEKKIYFAITKIKKTQSENGENMILILIPANNEISEVAITKGGAERGAELIETKTGVLSELTNVLSELTNVIDKDEIENLFNKINEEEGIIQGDQGAQLQEYLINEKAPKALRVTPKAASAAAI